MTDCLYSDAIVFEQPGKVGLRTVEINRPAENDVVVAVEASGISTGTEKLLWRGTMPAFPGLAYPLVPGYEAVGTVVDAADASSDLLGKRVFVPGASCYRDDIRGLFGASASTLVVNQDRVTPIESLPSEEGVLLALAATAMHALTLPLRQGGAVPHVALSDLAAVTPELIIGHGVLGRLLARIVVAVGGNPPLVHELNDARQKGARGYQVIAPADDESAPRRRIIDVSGAGGKHFDSLIARLAKGGELVLAGFYTEPVSFNFPQAFMREARLSVAAEWTPDDLSLVLSLIKAQALSLDGLISHSQPVAEAARAYRQAFDDPSCLKMIVELERRMNSSTHTVNLGDLKDMASRLREEAEIEPDPAPSGEIKKETQIIAIYGKGGIGKSFTLANLSYMMAQQGKKVLLIGCDPKSDTTSLLFGGRACPTIIETSSKKKQAGEQVEIGDVCFIRDGVYAMELGGPEVGRGCGGRGIIHGFELMEKLGFHEWDFDYVLLDFLGDVVCGGFGLPIARDMCQKVIVVGSNDLQSLYVANNVCSAVEYFRRLGGNVGVAGIVINKDDGTGEAHAFAEKVGIPVLSAIPADDDIRKMSSSYQIVGKPDGRWGPLFSELAQEVADSKPQHPTPLTQDELLGLFDADSSAEKFPMRPATNADLCGKSHVEKPTLEVVYDEA